MKKYIFFCLTWLMCSPLVAQDKPSFSFFTDYDSVRIGQASRALAKYDWKGNATQKKAIYAEFIQNLDNGEDIYTVAHLLKQPVSKHIRQSLVKHFTEKKDTNNMEVLKAYLTQDEAQWRTVAHLASVQNYTEGKAHFWDFDKNGMPEIIAIPAIYFGPSEGFRFYAKSKNTWKLLINNSGVVHHFEKKGQNIFIYFVMGVIDPSECDVFYTIHLNLSKQESVCYKAYFSTNTQIPAKLQEPATFALTQIAALRTQPKVDDEPDKQDAENTKTLRGNVVAVFPSGAKYWVLATEGEWSFVAFLPQTLPTETSLRHGMDIEYDQEMKPLLPKEKPYFVGWIKK